MENHFTVNEVKHEDGSSNFDLVQFDGNRRVTLHTLFLTEPMAQKLADTINGNVLSVSIDTFEGK